jgi:diguanylate cyclase (GGDEF)-like protein
MLQPSQPSVHAQQLRQFLSWLTPLAFLFAGLALVAGLVWRDRGSLRMSVLVAGYGALTVVARSQVARGQLRRAGLILGVGIVLTALSIVAIQPSLYPTLVVIPLLAVAVALPYADDRSFRGLLLGCWLAAVGIGALGELAPPTSLWPAWFRTAYNVSSLGAVVAMVLLLLWQSRARLKAHVTGMQAANVDLENAVEALRRKEEEIRGLAYYDALTGLPNRLMFFDRLEVALTQARRDRLGLAVLFLDLDHFKGVNDGFGHAAGDQLLQEVAARLRRGIRAGDTVARLAGDEFTLLLPGIDSPETAGRVAAKLLERVRPPVRLGEQEVRVTASAGISLFPAHADGAEALVKRADAAMYAAKQAGRDTHRLWTAPAS